MDLVKDIADRLGTFPLRPDYGSEEPELLDHVVGELEDLLGDQYEIVSKSSDEEDSVKTLGCSFWPDILVRQNGEDLLVLELKLVKKAKKSRSPSKAYAETMGQCIIYSTKYPAVIGLVVNYGLRNPEHIVFDAEIHEILGGHQIKLVIRR
jgi:hypothetical protein